MTTTPPVPTSNPHQPGKSWVVLDDGDGSINITLPLGFGEQQEFLISIIYEKSKYVLL